MKDPLDDAVGLDDIPQGDGVDASEGLTPSHPQNIDESRVDEILVDDALEDDNYPDIRDIADDNAVEDSYDDE